MKKLAAITCLLLGLAFTSKATVAPATGPVDLGNFGAGGIYQVNTSTAAPDGTMVQVYVNGNLQVTDSGSTFTTVNVDGAGVFFGGTAYTGEANNSSQTFTMYAWYGAATYALAQVTPGAMWGTVTWTQNVGSFTTPPPTTTPTSMTNPNLVMTVTAVPEPTTIVLGAMGGLALLVRRRKE